MLVLVCAVQPFGIFLGMAVVLVSTWPQIESDSAPPLADWHLA